MIQNILHYLLSGAVSKVIQFTLLFWLAGKLGPDGFGVFNVYISWAIIGALFVSFNLHSAISRYFYESKCELTKFLNTIIITISGLSLSWLLLIELINYLSNGRFYHQYIHAMYSLIIAELIANSYIQVAQAAQKSKKVAIFQIARYTIMAAATVLAVKSGLDMAMITLAIFGYSVGIFIPSLLVLTRYLYTSFRIELDKSLLIYAVNYALPLFIYALCTALILHSDRIMLSHLINDDAAGQYSYAALIGMVILLIGNSVLAGWTPTYFHLMNRGDHLEVRKQSIKILHSIGCITIFIATFAPPILRVSIPANFITSIQLFTALSLVYYLEVAWQLYGRHLGYLKLTRYIALIGLVTSTLNIALNYLLISLIGALGAVLSTLACYTLMILLAQLITNRKANLTILPLWPFASQVLFFSIYYFLNYMLQHNVYYTTSQHVILPVNIIFLMIYLIMFIDIKSIKTFYGSKIQGR